MLTDYAQMSPRHSEGNVRLKCWERIEAHCCFTFKTPTARTSPVIWPLHTPRDDLFSSCFIRVCFYCFNYLNFNISRFIKIEVYEYLFGSRLSLNLFFIPFFILIESLLLNLSN